MHFISLSTSISPLHPSEELYSVVHILGLVSNHYHLVVSFERVLSQFSIHRPGLPVDLMDSRESVAESEQYDEAAMRRIHRPPNLPLPEVTHEAIPYSAPLLEGPPMLGDPSTRIGVQFAPRPTLFVPFQFNEQLEGPAGHIQAQNVDLPEDIQRELAEAELRHEAARYQILEKAKTFPASSHSRETTTSYPYLATEETATGYTGAYDHLNQPVHPPHIPNQGLFSNDSGSTSAFDVQLEPGQELSQSIVYPHTLHDDVQGFGQNDNTFPTAQDLDYNALGHSTYGQQPAINSMAFATSHYNTMPSALKPYDQGNHLSSFAAPPQSQLTQPSLLLRDFGAVPVTASQLPLNTTNNLVFDTKDPSANLPLNSIINPFAGCSFPRTMDDPLSFSATGHSATSDIDTTSTNGHLVPVGAIRRTGMPSKWRQGAIASPYDKKKGPRPGREMENVFLHTDPVADRKRLKDLPKSRQVTDKALSSCFGCRLGKRKVCSFPSNLIFNISLTMFEVHGFDRRRVSAMSEHPEAVHRSHSSSEVYVHCPNKLP
jgi:hypothetical protein